MIERVYARNDDLNFLVHVNGGEYSEWFISLFSWLPDVFFGMR